MSTDKKLNLKLRKFDMSRIDHNNVVILIGKRRTGKSFLIRDLMYRNQTLPCGTVISGTEGSNQFFSKLVPSMFIHDEYTPILINNIVKRQNMIGKKIAKDMEEQGSTNVDPRNFLIMDDCLYDTTWTRDRNVRYLFMNGRHIQTLVVVSMQEPMGVPPALRTNTDFTFILRENIINNRRKLFEQWAGMFPCFDSFCQVMNQCTEDHECLVIDNNATSNKLEDQVFWYKASSTLPSFRLCSPIYWEKSISHTNEEMQADLDPSTGGPRRRFQLNVQRGQ